MPQKPPPTPHSWGIESWPADVYPHRPNRARYLVNTHRDDLMAAGALCRVGRELVVIGTRYTRWLERQASRVPDFTIAPNKPTEAA
jgi:hypothetical protein